jgi:ribosomal protein L37AE/L43A
MSNRLHAEQDTEIACNLCSTNTAERFWHGLQLCEDCWIFKQDDEEGVYDE